MFPPELHAGVLIASSLGPGLEHTAPASEPAPRFVDDAEPEPRVLVVHGRVVVEPVVEQLFDSIGVRRSTLSRASEPHQTASEDDSSCRDKVAAVLDIRCTTENDMQIGW